MKNWGHLGLFAGGLLFGTAGISILTSEDAKKVYTHCTAARPSTASERTAETSRLTPTRSTRSGPKGQRPRSWQEPGLS